MKDFIGFCGLDCETCEARIATINQNDELRQKVAREWSEMNRVEITPEMIHCTGCRIDGPKTPYCESFCPIRQCAVGKKVETCGACPEMESCEKLAAITGNNPDAAQHLQCYRYLSLRERPELLESAAAWFHEKWGVPEEAYHACMAAYLNRETEYGWYLCLAGNRIVGGLGVIENDFHDRKDLAPNVCAVYTEEGFRDQGIAGRLLDLVVEDMRTKCITPLYLVTDHSGFYERYGWAFLCMAHDDSGSETRVYMHQ